MGIFSKFHKKHIIVHKEDGELHPPYWDVEYVYDYAFRKDRGQYFVEKYDLKGYQLAFYQSASSLIDFRGARVLDIGGSETPLELAFDELGAEKWVCIDKPGPYYLDKYKQHYNQFPHYSIGKQSLSEAFNKSSYMLWQCFTDDLTEEFYSQFDVVVSNCCFEHITFLRDALNTMHSCLKPQGMLYSCFGPIYSCKAGTHYHVTNELNFSGNTLGLDLDFAHFLMSYDDLYKMLLPHFGPQDAEKAAFRIKTGYNQHLNEYFYEDYVDALYASMFDEKHMRPCYVTTPSIDKLKALSSMFPNNKRFDVWSVEMFCKKHAIGFDI